MLDTTTEAGPAPRSGCKQSRSSGSPSVRSDGQPQSVPVWFLRDGETFLIYSRPGQQKLKNIGVNPRDGLHLNSSARGGDVVRVEGTAEVVEDTPPADEVGEYVEKYTKSITRIGFDPAGFALTYSVALRVKPDRWHVW